MKEDLRAYADESGQDERLSIQARQILGFSAAYDVVDSRGGERAGVLRRKGRPSWLRDEWELLDAQEQPLGLLREDSLTRASLRRFQAGSWLPQAYDGLVEGKPVFGLRQRFNRLRYEVELDFRPDPARQLDRRLGIAAALLLGSLAGRQD